MVFSSSSEPTSSSSSNLLRSVVQIKRSPVEEDSPPPPDMPRTPSPSSSPQPIYQAQSPFDAMVASDMQLNHVPYMHQEHLHRQEHELKIPLKYQRQAKASSHKAYKKKFRTWEYDEELLAANADHIEEFMDNRELVSPMEHFGKHKLHKASKFRPKGKDWRNHEADAHV